MDSLAVTQGHLSNFSHISSDKMIVANIYVKSVKLYHCKYVFTNTNKKT